MIHSSDKPRQIPRGMYSTGLEVGDEVDIFFKDGGYDTTILNGVWLPVRIIEEYAKYFVCLVLPHRNPVQCWGISKEYKLCINKVAVKLGEVQVKGGYRKWR